MTLEQIQAYVGKPTVAHGLAYYQVHMGVLFAAWEDVLCGDAGWWVALVRPCGDHEIIETVTWIAGGPRHRDAEVARLARRTASARLVS